MVRARNLPILEPLVHAFSPELDLIHRGVKTVENIFFPNKSKGKSSGSTGKPIGTKRPSNRSRTGVPYNDSLIGIEPNPGPRAGKKGKPRRKGNSGALSVSQRSRGDETVSRAAAYGARSGKIHFTSHGKANFLGSSNASRFTGRHVQLPIARDAAGNIVFQDNAGTNTYYVPLNPRVCCQTSNFHIPNMLCPIGMISCAYRYFCFTKLKLHYTPLAAPTTDSSVVQFAFVPDQSVGLNLDGNTLRMIEASTYAVCWQSQTLDVTPFLDRSRWFRSETTNTPTNGDATRWCAGVLACRSPLAGLGAPAQLGVITMEYEVMLEELGPSEIMTNPGYRGIISPEVAVFNRSYLLSGKDERKEGDDSEINVSGSTVSDGSSISISTNSCSCKGSHGTAAPILNK